MRYLRAMSVERRNNVHTFGDGPATMFFAHGFGCDQNMWRLLVPTYRERYRVVLFDLVGSGNSDLSAYDPTRYASLQGYADDVLEIVDAFATGPALFVGHSVSSMIGMLANLAAPDRFAAQLMIGPSPCYINDGDYVGGFTRQDIEGLLDTLDSNYLGWSSNMAPAIMGAPEQPVLAEELTNSFCRTDPEIAKQFARVTFLSDLRPQLPKLRAPTLIVQCDDDMIAPVAVGEYMHRVIPTSTLAVIANIGHCPHLSAPGACVTAMDAFLAEHRM
jgi:sigma-B regulation protein RsbQ